MCKLLVDKSADANLRDHNNMRAFDVAYQAGHKGSCEEIAKKTDFSSDPDVLEAEQKQQDGEIDIKKT